MQVVTMPGQPWRLYRCAACATGTAPADLGRSRPAARAELQGRMETLASVAVLFQRPAKPRLVPAPKKRAYRGEPNPIQGGMLDTLPRRW